MKQRVFDFKPLLIAAITGTFCGVLLLFGAFSSVQLRVQDLLYPERHTQPDVVLVVIDDASLQAVGRWPWDRTVTARLVRALAPAKIVGLDINFPELSTPAADQELADAISGAGNVVLPVELTYGPDGRIAVSALQPIETIRSAAVALAHTNTPPDPDGVVRRIPLSSTLTDGTTYHAMGEIVARRAGARAGGVETDPQGRMLVPFVGAPGAFRTVRAADVLSGAVSPESFRDLIVLVGVTAPDLHDERMVPTSRGVLMSGVEIHANVADALLSRTFASELPLPFGALVALGLALLVGALIPLMRIRMGLLVVLASSVGYALVVVVLAGRGLFLPILNPVVGVFLTYLSVTMYRYIRANQEKNYLRHAFEKYVSASVINSIMEHPDKLALGGERRRMTVLFSDLRGFTSLSEQMDATELVKLLNRYLDAMTDAVLDEQGVLDKYMGDAVMAFWGAPFVQPDHAERALRAALRMRDKLAVMNRDQIFGRDVVLRLGIGVSTGDMVVGNMGSRRRFDYTVMGDTVNLGSRVEGINKVYGTEILLTEEAVKGLSSDFVVRPLDRVAVKGKNESVRLYELVGRFEMVTPEVRDKLERFARALTLYETSDLHSAEIAFADILALYPNDGPSQVFYERSRHLQQHPPDEGWGGVWVMHTK
jgi:adenylate cyclase